MANVRVQIKKDGSVPLPKIVREALDVGPGSYVEIAVEKEQLVLKKIQFDPFAQAAKKPDPDAFEKIMQRQKEGLVEAEKEFMDRLKEPPEIKPEDRHDFWD